MKEKNKQRGESVVTIWPSHEAKKRGEVPEVHFGTVDVYDSDLLIIRCNYGNVYVNMRDCLTVSEFEPEGPVPVHITGPDGTTVRGTSELHMSGDQGQQRLHQWAEDMTGEERATGEHKHRPDDDPEPGDRCKDCRKPIVWVGPGMDDWQLA